MVKRLILAPHPDDETLGCGGLIAKYPDEVAVHVLAYCGSVRENQMYAAMEKLVTGGVKLTQDSFIDGEIGSDPKELTGVIDSLLVEHKPDELYLPFPGTHQDHVAVFEAGLRASRLSMKREHWMPRTVLVYDTPAYGLELRPSGLQWNVFEQLSAVQVQRKAHAMGCYESEVPDAEHPAGEVGVVSSARAIGAPNGLPFAERYAAVRVVRT